MDGEALGVAGLASAFGAALLGLIRAKFNADREDAKAARTEEGKREERRIATEERMAAAMSSVAAAVAGLTHHVQELRGDFESLTPPPVDVGHLEVRRAKTKRERG